MADKKIGESDIERLTTADLVSRLRESSPEESSIYSLEIVRRFEPILRFVWRRVESFIEYQDFVQDVFVRLFSHLPQLIDPESFPGYFKAIALSVAHDHIRKRLTTPVEAGNEFDESAPGLKQLITSLNERLHTAIFLQSYLEQLSPKERNILILDFFYGYSLKEAAALLDTTPAAVRIAKHRALNKLREWIRAEGGKTKGV